MGSSICQAQQSDSDRKATQLLSGMYEVVSWHDGTALAHTPNIPCDTILPVKRLRKISISKQLETGWDIKMAASWLHLPMLTFEMITAGRWQK